MTIQTNNAHLPAPLRYLHEWIYPRRDGTRMVETITQDVKDLVYGSCRGDLLPKNCFPFVFCFFGDLDPRQKTYEVQKIDTCSFMTGLIMWEVCGRNSFMFSPTLTELLRNTNLKDVPSYAVRAPYDSVWLELPGDYNGGHSNGCFVTRHVETERWGRWGECRSMWREGEIPDHGMEYLMLVFRQTRKTSDSGKHLQKMDLLPIPLLEGKMIEECIARAETWKLLSLAEDARANKIAECEALFEAHARYRRGGHEGLIIREAWGGMVEAAINALLYLSSPKADLQPVEIEPPKRRQSKFEKRTYRRRKHRSVQVGLRFTPAGPRKASTTKAKSGSGRHPRLHRVRGHWKMVPYGQGRKQRRATWIEPFWRGQGEVEQTPRTAYTSK